MEVVLLDFLMGHCISIRHLLLFFFYLKLIINVLAVSTILAIRLTNRLKGND